MLFRIFYYYFHLSLYGFGYSHAHFVSVPPCLSHLSTLTSMILFYFHSPLLYFCLSVRSPAVVPPCSRPSVWIVFLLLLLTTIAIKTSTLPPSFPFTMETLTLYLPTPPLTHPLLHSTPPLCNFPITFPLLLIHSLYRLPFKTPLSTIALSLHTTLDWIPNPKLVRARCNSFKQTTVLYLAQIQTACPTAAAPTR